MSDRMQDRKVIVRLSNEDYKKISEADDSVTGPIACIAEGIRVDDTEDFDFDTLYSNEVISYTPTPLPFDIDPYEPWIVIFYPEGCKLVEIPNSFDE